MSVDYNLNPNLGSRTLAGNWFENRRLEDIGVLTRVPGGDGRKVDTFERVAPNSHSEKAKAATALWDSEAREKMKDVNALARAAGVGPRAVLREKLVQAEAKEFAASLLVPKVELLETRTTSATTYVPHDASAYRPLLRRPVASESGGSALPSSASSTDTSHKLGVTVRTGAYDTAHYANAAPVTYWSARAGEGVYPSSAMSGRNIFARSSAFTNPLDEAGPRRHAEANERRHFSGGGAHSELTLSTSVSMTKNSSTAAAAREALAAAPPATLRGSSFAVWNSAAATAPSSSSLSLSASPSTGSAIHSRAPGAELSVQRCCLRFLRRIGEGLPCPHQALGPFLGHLHAPPRTPSALGATAFRLTEGGIACDEMHVAAEAMRAVAPLWGGTVGGGGGGTRDAAVIAFVGRELEELIAATDIDGTGRVYLPLFIEHLASTVGGRREEAVKAAYARVGGEGASVIDLITRFRPDAIPQVQAGQAAADDALQSLMSLFIELGIREDEEAPYVVFVAFCATISASVPSDEAFDKAMLVQWP